MARRKRVLVSSPPEFDPVDSAAEHLAESMLRKSPKFTNAKNQLKKKARQEMQKLLDGKVKF